VSISPAKIPIPITLAANPIVSRDLIVTTFSFLSRKTIPPVVLTPGFRPVQTL